MPHSRAAEPDRNAQVRRVLLGLFIANLCVVVAKLVIGMRSGSLGVLGDAVHSSVDASNNILALAVIWIAARAPDDDHPYGHEKFETLGALAIVMFLSITGFELVKGAITRLSAGAPPIQISNLELGILVGTLLLNTVVTIYEERRGRQLNSPILLADAAHTRADVFVTIGVITGVIFGRNGYGVVDPLMALGVAVVIVLLAYRIVVRTVPELVDKLAMPPEDIQRAAESISGVERAYAIRSRGTQERRFAELTIAVNGAATVEDAHAIADLVESTLQTDLTIHEVVVHIEPC
jgi:cation diffusion facilitator family transporter